MPKSKNEIGTIKEDEDKINKILSKQSIETKIRFILSLVDATSKDNKKLAKKNSELKDKVKKLEAVIKSKPAQRSIVDHFKPAPAPAPTPAPVSEPVPDPVPEPQQEPEQEQESTPTSPLADIGLSRTREVLLLEPTETAK